MHNSYLKRNFGFMSLFKKSSNQSIKSNNIIDKQTSMNKELIYKIMDIIRSQLFTTNIKLSSKLEDDLGADDLDIVELAMELEEVFNITITENEMYKCKTVDQLCNLINKKIAKQKR